MSKAKAYKTSAALVVTTTSAIHSARAAEIARINAMSARQLAVHHTDAMRTLLSTGELSLMDYEDERSRFGWVEGILAIASLNKLIEHAQLVRGILRENRDAGGAS